MVNFAIALIQNDKFRCFYEESDRLPGDQRAETVGICQRLIWRKSYLSLRKRFAAIYNTMVSPGLASQRYLVCWKLLGAIKIRNTKGQNLFCKSAITDRARCCPDRIAENGGPAVEHK